MKDTPESFKNMMCNRMMRLSAEKRVELACDMFDMHKALAIASMPELSGADLQVALFQRFYGNDFDEQTKLAICAHLRRQHGSSQKEFTSE